MLRLGLRVGLSVFDSDKTGPVFHWYTRPFRYSTIPSRYSDFLRYFDTGPVFRVGIQNTGSVFWNTGPVLRRYCERWLMKYRQESIG